MKATNRKTNTAAKPDPIYAAIEKHVEAHARLYRAYDERAVIQEAGKSDTAIERKCARLSDQASDQLEAIAAMKTSSGEAFAAKVLYLAAHETREDPRWRDASEDVHRYFDGIEQSCTALAVRPHSEAYTGVLTLVADITAKAKARRAEWRKAQQTPEARAERRRHRQAIKAAKGEPVMCQIAVLEEFHKLVERLQVKAPRMPSKEFMEILWK